MTVSVGMVTFDTRDARALAAWWARQLDGRVHDQDDGWFVVVVPAGGGMPLGFQRVEDPTPGKNRGHVDVHAPDRDAEVARLVAEGASFVAQHEHDGFVWAVLEDPDGNQFCVLSAPETATQAPEAVVSP
ncbi:VOC family protein [Cellulomonas soli]|uniref:VOC family protein n=1 Tax=Cellulomonas soli TaxID=931535 RepID=UPI003F834229